MIHNINKMKDKNPNDRINRSKKKSFDKIQHLFMIKALSKVGTEGTYLNRIGTYMTNPLLASYSTGNNYKYPP